MAHRYAMRRKSARVRDRCSGLFGVRTRHRLRARTASKVLFANPYQHHRKELLPKKIKIELGFLICLVLGIFFLILYHPFFSIQKIEIQGLERISEESVSVAILGVLDDHLAFILPRKSYLLTNIHDIRDILLHRFPIEHIIVEKMFPHTLRVVVQEKISTLIYDNGTIYALIGLDGKITEVLGKVGENEWEEKGVDGSPTSTSASTTITKIHRPDVRTVHGSFGSYPIVYDVQGKEVTVNSDVLSGERIEAIVGWLTFLERQLKIPYRYVELDEEGHGAMIRMGEGWDLRVDLQGQQTAQFARLQSVFSQLPPRTQLQYIDVRYQERVYWK